MEKMSRMFDCFKTVNYVYLVVLSGNFLALTGDAAITWPSPVIAKLSSNDTDNPLGRPITEDEQTWIASIGGYGSLLGVLPFCFLPDMIGRKPSLLLVSIPHMLSFGFAAFATTIDMIYIARFLSGLSICACYLVLPMYVAEVSENSNRGLMLVSFAIFSNFGSLLSYVTGPYLSMFWFNIFLLIFPLTFFVLFCFIAPESPYYYVRKGDFTNAIRSIEKLRCNNFYKNAELELRNMQVEMENVERGKVLDTLKRRYAIKGSLIALVLTSFQQLSGYAVYIPYTQIIFEQAGSSKSISAISSIIVGSVAFFSSFICPFVIDKKGRRFVLTISLCGIIISEVVFGFFYYMRDEKYDMEPFKWVPLACLMGYMLFFTFGLGPLPLTITSEILPANIKFLVSTTAGILGTISSTVLSKNYNFLNNNLHYYGTIWMFAGFVTFLLIFVLLLLPETKGKSFAEILREL